MEKIFYNNQTEDINNIKLNSCKQSVNGFSSFALSNTNTASCKHLNRLGVNKVRNRPRSAGKCTSSGRRRKVLLASREAGRPKQRKTSKCCLKNIYLSESILAPFWHEIKALVSSTLMSRASAKAHGRR